MLCYFRHKTKEKQTNAKKKYFFGLKKTTTHTKHTKKKAYQRSDWDCPCCNTQMNLTVEKCTACGFLFRNLNKSTNPKKRQKTSLPTVLF